ncbi:hypothetical protein BGZ96_009887 [Linnemannia gamsii]|uniref:Thiamine-binding protein domain-containing protein n=1 Tax=Linnemannia gamsii TaxID=64522 RepID=A0ABQ7JWG6_9FUNG|nr:hypothetical protein BGZ96_009887 [Linnemannia gamsii]
MYQPEQKIHPLDREENETTSTSTIGEKMSSLGEKLSDVTIGGSSEKKITDTGAGEQKFTQGLPSKEESTTHCLADFAIYPLGTTTSFQKHIDEIEKVLKRCGIDYKVHAQCTTIEGEMGAITYAIKACHEALHAMGCPRIASNIRFETGARNYRQLPLEYGKDA